MSDNSAIEWTDATWSPVTGCDRVSPGCDHCYAMTLAKRLKAMGQPKYQTDGDPRTSGPGFGVATHPDTLALPLGWRRPRRIFVNSMSDLFHDKVPDEFIAKVFAVMAMTPQHTYQVLTKRHGRMRSLLGRSADTDLLRESFEDEIARQNVNGHIFDGRMTDPVWAYGHKGRRAVGKEQYDRHAWPGWPLPNVWLGVSVEDQKRADLRIPALLATPAAVRFLSCEPLLGPVNLGKWLGPVDWPACWDEHEPSDECSRCVQPEWVIAGGESGKGARPMHPDWARSLRDQCVAAGVAYHFKQHGEWQPIGPLYDQHDGDEEADEARMDAVGWEVEMGKQVIQLESSGHVADGHQPTDPRTWLMVRRGKKASGRLLDGRTWDDYPVERPLVGA